MNDDGDKDMGDGSGNDDDGRCDEGGSKDDGEGGYDGGGDDVCERVFVVITETTLRLRLFGFVVGMKKGGLGIY